MTVMTETEAAAERAAIHAELAARNIPAEVKEPKFTPTAEAARARKARRLAGKVELSAEDATATPKRFSWHDTNRRDYTRLELAELAAETKRMERAAERAERAAAKRVAESRRLAAVIIQELPEQAASMAAAAGESAQLDYARMISEAAAVLGESDAEAAATIAAAVAYEDAPKPARGSRGNVGYGSTNTPAELAAVADWTAEMLASPAAVAGRAALDAIGPRAAGLVLSNRAADTLTIARSIRVPSLKVAERRAEESADALADATAKLADAEAAVMAARGRKAKRPIDAAEADANRIAAVVPKLAARAELAAKLAATAEALDGLGLVQLEAFLAEPVAELALSKAAEAAAVPLRIRADIMPVPFRHNGPTAKAARAKSDPTGDSAAALADGYRAELARAEAAAEDLAARTSGRAAGLAAAAETEARRLAYKERRAEAARARRAEDKAARSMAGHNERRAAKRAAR